MSSTPARGRKVMTLRIGKPIWSFQVTSRPPDPGEDDDQDQHAREHGQGVVLHAPGLQGPQALAEDLPEAREPVDGAVDDLGVEERPQPPREGDSAADGHDLVDLVHVHLVEGRLVGGRPVSYTHLTLPTNREV